jgi:ribosome-associated toxin RatA of RatAB toxin-antitoxin module
MAEQTEGNIEIVARPGEIMAVIADFDVYPEWAEGIRSTQILSRDEDGRGTEVAFEFSAMGFNASYTLRYEYLPEDSGVRWTTTQASGAVKDIRGEYELEPLNGDTRVTYRLTVEPAIPLPGFLRRQADRKAIKTALEGLKKRVEG